jgi:rubrerythrin
MKIHFKIKNMGNETKEVKKLQASWVCDGCGKSGTTTFTAPEKVIERCPFCKAEIHRFVQLTPVLDFDK